jgi:hypothetical protein
MKVSVKSLELWGRWEIEGTCVFWGTNVVMSGLESFPKGGI